MRIFLQISFYSLLLLKIFYYNLTEKYNCLQLIILTLQYIEILLLVQTVYVAVTYNSVVF